MSEASRTTVDQLQALYARSVENLRVALKTWLQGGPPPETQARAEGAFAYPEIRLTYRPQGPLPALRSSRAFGRLVEPGVYASTVTRPDLFSAYLQEQIDLLTTDFGATVEVGLSRQEIPFPYVLDGADMALDAAVASELARWFPATELAHIGDEIPDGLWSGDADTPRPLSLFDGLRTDFSLARLKHYTGTPPEHVQKYVLFTNYHRYVDEFVRWACAQLGNDNSPYTALSAAGGVYVTSQDQDPVAAVDAAAWRKHQMPAYHLMTADGRGVTLVNIGVGPANAKTITDHLAVLRPEAWLMIGHCGGLRSSQSIGDYVLAHAYLRDDHVLDDVLPPEIPVPAIAEVQQALQAGAERISGQSRDVLRTRLRTGTVVTTDDRNWELRFTRSAIRFSQSRAVAIDMESATIAGQGYRLRVPYGTLLCVSDKPLHGEIKLPGQANRFYEQAISEHLMIGIAALEDLRAAGDRLHSRKLRAFSEPPFR